MASDDVIWFWEMSSEAIEDRLVLSRALMIRRCSLKPWSVASSSSCRLRFLVFEISVVEYIEILSSNGYKPRVCALFECWGGCSC